MAVTGAATTGAAATATAAERRQSSRRPGWTVLTRWGVAVAVASALVLGVVMRVWYLVHDPINSDQALIGITARQILAGHLHAFLPGLHYEAVEPYLVAAVFRLFGASPLTLEVPVLVCDVVACVLVWRIALRLSHRGDVAAICAAAMWAAPQGAVWNSTMEYGFRGVTLLCGTGMVLLALRLSQGSSRPWDAPLLGALFGVGWWSSPEIVYFALPSAIWTAAWLWRGRHDPPVLARRAAAAAGGLLAAGAGALPWLWDNVTSGFPSLKLSSFDAPGAVPPYRARLVDVFHGAVPTVLDLRVPRSGAWDVPAGLGVVALVVLGGAIVAAAAWQLWRRGDGSAVAAGVVAYPFVLAAAPSSVAWQSARYTNFLVPLLALLAAAVLGDAAANRHPGVHHRPRAGGAAPAVAAVAAVVLAGVVATSMVAFGDLQAINVLPGSRLGTSPNQPARRLAAGLERAGVRGGYADYWIAYKLDFLTAGRLELTDAPPSPDRLPAVTRAVRALPARRQAWLFLAPSPTARTEYADTPVIQGPSGLPLSVFESDLKGMGVTYRVRRIAGAVAVVCGRPVTPADLGMRGPTTP